MMGVIIPYKQAIEAYRRRFTGWITDTTKIELYE